MTKIIGVRFRNNGRVYFFDPGMLAINEGDSVIVETAHGIEFGYVARGISEVEDSEIVQPLVPVLRIATEEDKQMRETYLAKEPEAFNICTQKIEQHKLNMKLVRVEYAFNGSKVVFYFTADERVDFRDLVKDLAFQFRTRIELRQIGVRDEAKMLGGLGPCGRPICCKQFLDDFSPVSIKMAKEQNLSLSPTKISGLCGRLMCCLQYEEAAYEDMKKLMPRVGKETQTPDGIGTVLENNAITELTRVKIQLPDGTFDQKWYHYTFLSKPGEAVPAQERPVDVPATEQKANATVVADASPASGERKRRRGGQKKPAESAVEPSGEKSEPAETREAPKGESRRRRRPSQPRPATDKPAESKAPVQKQHAEAAAPAKPAEGKDGEAVKRRRHRGGRKHRPHNPRGTPESGTPSEN